jgi:hypothetical protein
MHYHFPHLSYLICFTVKLQTFQRWCPSMSRSWWARRTKAGLLPMMLSCSRVVCSCHPHHATGRKCWRKLMALGKRVYRRCCNVSEHPSTRRTTTAWCISSSRAAWFASGTRQNIFISSGCCNHSTCPTPYGLTLSWISSKDFLEWG